MRNVKGFAALRNVKDFAALRNVKGLGSIEILVFYALKKVNAFT